MTLKNKIQAITGLVRKNLKGHLSFSFIMGFLLAALFYASLGTHMMTLEGKSKDEGDSKEAPQRAQNTDEQISQEVEGDTVTSETNEEETGPDTSTHKAARAYQVEWDSVRADSVIAEVRTCSKHKKEAFPLVSLSLTALMLIAGSALLVNGPFRMEREEEIDEDYRDPEFLRRFFEEHQEQIQELGTPRKIKRFCNKVRYQATPIQKREDTMRSAYLELLLYIELYGSNDSLLDVFSEFRDFVHSILEGRNNYGYTAQDGELARLEELREEDLDELLHMFYDENRSILI